MVFSAVAGSLLIILLLIALIIRTNNWRNRRKAQRRNVLERRVNPGQRKCNIHEYENAFSERRKCTDRRERAVTRRHKKRRTEDRLGHY